MRHVVKHYKYNFKGKCLDIGGIAETIDQMPEGAVGLNILPEHEQILHCDLNKDVIPFPDNHFDFIFFSHTLEHTESPYRLLKECKRVLRPKGRMIIAVPRFVRWTSSNFERYEHGHKYFWTGRTIKHMIWMLGFKPIKKWNNYPCPFKRLDPLMYFLWNCRLSPFYYCSKDIHILCEIQK